jgi:hypothetical protein
MWAAIFVWAAVFMNEWTNRRPSGPTQMKRGDKPLCTTVLPRSASPMRFVHRRNGLEMPDLMLPEMRRIVNCVRRRTLGLGVRPSGRVSPCPATALRQGFLTLPARLERQDHLPSLGGDNGPLNLQSLFCLYAWIHTCALALLQFSFLVSDNHDRRFSPPR